MSDPEVKEVHVLDGYRLVFEMRDGTFVGRDLLQLLGEPTEPDYMPPREFSSVWMEKGCLAWPSGAELRIDPILWGGFREHGPDDEPPRNAVVRPNGTLHLIDDPVEVPSATGTNPMVGPSEQELERLEDKALEAIESPGLDLVESLARDVLDLVAVLRSLR